MAQANQQPPNHSIKPPMPKEQTRMQSFGTRAGEDPLRAAILILDLGARPTDLQASLDALQKLNADRRDPASLEQPTADSESNGTDGAGKLKAEPGKPDPNLPLSWSSDSWEVWLATGNTELSPADIPQPIARVWQIAHAPRLMQLFATSMAELLSTTESSSKPPAVLLTLAAGVCPTPDWLEHMRAGQLPGRSVVTGPVLPSNQSRSEETQAAKPQKGRMIAPRDPAQASFRKDGEGPVTDAQLANASFVTIEVARVARECVEQGWSESRMFRQFRQRFGDLWWLPQAIAHASNQAPTDGRDRWVRWESWHQRVGLTRRKPELRSYWERPQPD